MAATAADHMQLRRIAADRNLVLRLGERGLMIHGVGFPWSVVHRLLWPPRFAPEAAITLSQTVLNARSACFVSVFQAQLLNSRLKKPIGIGNCSIGPAIARRGVTQKPHRKIYFFKNPSPEPAVCWDICWDREPMCREFACVFMRLAAKLKSSPGSHLPLLANFSGHPRTSQKPRNPL